MLIYTNQSSGRKRKSKSKKLAAAAEEHKKFLVSVGYTKRRRPVVDFPDLKVENINVASLSDAIPSNGFKRSVDDWKWKRDRGETAETIAEIERKKKQVAPLWNKGATMFISDQTDPETLGKKV